MVIFHVRCDRWCLTRTIFLVFIIHSMHSLKDTQFWLCYFLFTGNFLKFPNWESVGNFSHYWEMVGTTFSSHGKRLVKVWVYFSQCWVHFGKWGKLFFKIPMLGIQWVFSPEYGKMMGLFFHKLGNISTCYSQFWEMQGTRNPHLGKGLVKVRVTFSRYRV